MVVIQSSIKSFTESIETTYDNIANHSSISFKPKTSVIKSGPVGDGNIVHVGRREISSQGVTSFTNHPTDFVIDGEAMCVVTKQPGQENPDVAFTRAASFRQNKEGMLLNQAGYTLMGWKLGENDNLPAGFSTITSLVPIDLRNIIGSAQSTSEICLGMNLDAEQQAMEQYDATDGQQNLTASHNRPYVSQKSITVFDCLGHAHNIVFNFAKKEIITDSATNSPQQTVWAVEINGAKVNSHDYDISNKNNNIDGQIAHGEITFDGCGNLISISEPLQQPLSLLWKNGAKDNSITVDWGEVGSEGHNFQNGITQMASPFSVRLVEQNGYKAGNVKSVSIDHEGYVNAYMTNGVLKKIYQVPVVTFANMDGLDDIGCDAYTTSSESGAEKLQTANSANVSFITNAIEQPNFDPSSALTDLIQKSQMFNLMLRAQAKELEKLGTILNELRV